MNAGRKAVTCRVMALEKSFLTDYISFPVGKTFLLVHKKEKTSYNQVELLRCTPC